MPEKTKKELNEEIKELTGRVRELTECCVPENARKALEESVERYSTLVETAPHGIQENDTSGTITFSNRAHSEMLGYEEGELVGRTIWDSLETEEDKEGLRQHLEMLVREQPDPTPAFSRNRTKDGGFVNMRIDWNYKRDKQGRLTGFVSVITDITVQKRAEETLKGSEERYRTLFEDSMDVVFVTTPDGKILNINTAGVKLFEYSSKEEFMALGSVSELYVDPDTRELFKRRIERSGFVKNFDMVGKTKSGRRLNLLLTANTAYNDEGRPTAYHGIIHDMTGHKSLEAQLMHSQKMEAVGTLAGGIAHDFNNIITVVKTLTDLALSKIDDTNQCYKYLKPINESALTALNLVQQLLLFGRNQPFEPETLSLNDTAERLMGLIEHMLGEDISVKTDFAHDLWKIKADKGRLEQILMNLVINSNEAMNDGGCISIKTENLTLNEEQCSSIHGAVPGRYICLTVEDTGTGIDKEVMGRIFEPFFTTKTGKGTGMGLAVVYSIVTEHKGWINVTSTPDSGACFRVCLPGAEIGEEVKAQPLSPVKNAGRGKRILLVEDEKWVRKSTAMVLTDNGYEVFEAANAEKALSLFYREKGHFDMVFSDVVMPGRSGLQLVSPLLDLKPNMPILLCSGYLDDKNQLSQIIKRGLAYIQKPFEIPELLQAVEETIAEERGRPRA